ncbi:MAG: M16 family metallopeptidase [Opitutales bacterium]
MPTALRQSPIIRFLTLLGTCLLFASPALPVMADALRSGQWPHEAYDLKPDPEVTWGRLDNGFRYALRPHDGQSGRISMNLLVLAGSLDETPAEHGIAHFIEHMAFNGTERYPPGKLAAFFKRLGMEAGHDINAFTTLDHTVYTLELPENSAALQTESLGVLSDFAFRISFDPEEIEKERGVIQSERRIYDGMQFRADRASEQFFYPGLTFPDRVAIGTPESIDNLRTEQFRSWYRRHYRPDLMVLVVAGDFEVSGMKQRVEAAFGQQPRPKEPVPERRIGQLDTPRSLRAAIFQVTNVGSAAIRAATVRPPQDRADSRDDRRVRMEENLASALLGQRTNRLIRRGSGGDAIAVRRPGADAAMASIQVAGRDWRNGVLSMDELIRFTHEKGFTDDEWAWFRKRRLHSLEKQREMLGRLSANDLAQAMVSDLAADRVVLGPDRDLALQLDMLRSISLRDLDRRFRDLWDPDRLSFFITGDVAIEGGARAILSAVNDNRRSRNYALLPLSRQKTTEFELQNWGPASEIAEADLDGPFGLNRYRLSNNVRVNHIETDAEPGVVHAVVRVGSGLFSLPYNQPGLREFGLDAVLRRGTTHYRTDELQTIAAQSFLRFSFDVADHDAFSFRAVMAADELTTFLGVVTDYLDDPRFSSFVTQSAKKSAFQERSSGAQGIGQGQKEFTNKLFGQDARFVWGEPKDFLRIGIFDVQSWLEEPLSRGYTEVSIVGDIPADLAMESVLRTLGQLDDRAPVKEVNAPRKPVKMAIPGGYYRFEFVGEEHQSAVAGYWPVLRDMTLEDEAALRIIQDVLGQRIRDRVREDEGLAYSPSTNFESFVEYPDFAAIRTTIDCSPEDAPRIAREILDLSADLARTGVDEDDIVGVAAVLDNQLRRGFRQPGFLLANVAMRAQERPDTLDRMQAYRDGLVASISPEKVNALAREILKPSNAYAAAFIPKPYVGLFQESKGGTGGNVIGRK